MKNSVIILLVIWMALAVVNFVSLIAAPCLFYTICNWVFCALNASVFVSFVSMLTVEFKERRLAKKYPADSDMEETPVEEVPAPKKKRAKKTE